MSADNYVYIRRESDEDMLLSEACWKGYMESASVPRPLLAECLFTASNIPDALEQASTYATEYSCVVEGVVSGRYKE